VGLEVVARAGSWQQVTGARTARSLGQAMELLEASGRACADISKSHIMQKLSNLVPDRRSLKLKVGAWNDTTSSLKHDRLTSTPHFTTSSSLPSRLP